MTVRSLSASIFASLFVLASACVASESPTATKNDEGAIPMPHTLKPETRARLDAFASKMLALRGSFAGYPLDEDTQLKGFYEWYLSSGLYSISMNNVGDPREESELQINTHEYENEVVDYFAPRFGFEKGNYWGFVTHSGTDGNDHGVYFGKKYLEWKSKLAPIAYVSEEAHYSIKKLADVQGLELRLIKATPMGQMDIEDFKAQLDTTRPALIVVAIGTTFRGAIDDQKAIEEVLQATPPPAVYRHADAALFGSFLAFLDDPKARETVSQKAMKFNSIAVSGHKFWGMDEPCGIFVCTKEVRDHLNAFKVSYLNQAVPTITCSRNAIAPLKFWWKIQTNPSKTFERMAETCVANAQYLHDELTKLGVKSWINPYSNTVFFKRPSEAIMNKYELAPDVSPVDGDLAHLIVMQHVTRQLLKDFLQDMGKEKTALASPLHVQ